MVIISCREERLEKNVLLILLESNYQQPCVVTAEESTSLEPQTVNVPLRE